MKLHRVYRDGAAGAALGVLRDDAGRIFFTTLEDKPIPAGTYVVKLMPAEANPKHGECFEVQNVPDRTDILFHPGNDVDDSEGCILVGYGFSEFRLAITSSRVAYRRFRRFLANVREFTLVITDPT
jgi:hypothetical protein